MFTCFDVVGLFVVGGLVILILILGCFGVVVMCVGCGFVCGFVCFGVFSLVFSV